MNLKECVLENSKCENIIAKAVEITSYIEIKKDGKWLLDKEKLLNKKIRTSTRIGNESIVIEYYMYR